METKRKSIGTESDFKRPLVIEELHNEEQIVSIHTDMSIVNNQPMNRTIVHLKGDRIVELRQRIVEVQGNQVPELYWFRLPPLPKD